MHMEMLLVLLLSLVVCQFAILLWKKYHLKSYQVNSKNICEVLAGVFDGETEEDGTILSV